MAILMRGVDDVFQRGVDFVGGLFATGTVSHYARYFGDSRDEDLVLFAPADIYFIVLDSWIFHIDVLVEAGSSRPVLLVFEDFPDLFDLVRLGFAATEALQVEEIKASGFRESVVAATNSHRVAELYQEVAKVCKLNVCILLSAHQLLVILVRLAHLFIRFIGVELP